MKNLFTIILLSIPFLLTAQLINDNIRYKVLIAEMFSSADGDVFDANEYSMIYSVTSSTAGSGPEECYTFTAWNEGSGDGSSNPIGAFYDVPYHDFFTIYLNAWEDDVGERCVFEEGDDSFYFGFASINDNCITCQPEGPTAWMQGIGYAGTTNWVIAALMPLTDRWNFRMEAIWRYEAGDDPQRPLNFGEITHAGQKIHTNNNRTVSDNNTYAYQYQDYRSEPSPEVHYAFEIYGASSSNVVITTEFPETNFDTKIYLLDNDNNEIAVNDDIATGNTASEIVAQLCAGRYKVIVEGYATEQGTFKIGVTATAVAEVSGEAIFSEQICPGQTDGFINISLMGGFPPYSIGWPNGVSPTDTVISNLGAGTYHIPIGDNCGMAGSFNVIILGTDFIAPTAICADTTDVVISTGEILDLNPLDFDGGSFDNCSSNLQFYMFPSQVSASDPAILSYELQVTDEGGYTGICQGYIRVQVVTAVSQDAELEKAFSVYPNPTKGLTTVSIKGLNIDNGLLILRDMKGMLIQEQRMNTFEGWSKEFDISDLPSGVYTLQIIADGRQLTKKVVKY